jgi:hypothetical protein
VEESLPTPFYPRLPRVQRGRAEKVPGEMKKERREKKGTD